MVTALVRVTISYRAVELGLSIIGLGFIACAFAIFPILIAVQVGRLHRSRSRRADRLDRHRHLSSSSMVDSPYGPRLRGCWRSPP